MKAAWALKVFLSCNPGTYAIVVTPGLITGPVVVTAAVIAVGCGLLATYLESN